MGFKKTPQEVYARAWSAYQDYCQKEGFVALSQYCLTTGMKVQRLYEWLRRRKISLSDYQRSFEIGQHTVAESPGTVSFCEVEVPKSSGAGGRSGVPSVIDAEVCFELRSGDAVRMKGVSVGDVARLMESLNRGYYVGS